MIQVLSNENMRKSDAFTCKNLIPSKELMFRAGKAIFESRDWQGNVAIVCGKGNNAGDGYVLARLLQQANISCTIFLLSEKFSVDGEYYFSICKENGIPIRKFERKEDLEPFQTIVDCIFGTGFKGEVKGIEKEAIEAINASKAYVISIDINSGLNGDNGMAKLCVISSLTISIGSYKPGHFLNMAKDVIKKKINFPIGISPIEKPFALLEEDDIIPLFSPRKNFSNKGNYGYVALIGGSKRYSGAIRLASLANAAMRSGAGVVKLAVPSSLAPLLAPNILESTLFPLSENENGLLFVEEEIANLISNVKTIAFGMGIGTSNEAKKLLEYLLTHFKGKLIVDADGLNLLSSLGDKAMVEATCSLILTPHLKEFSRLINKSVDEILEEPIPLAKEFAKNNHLILLLKGPTSIITDGEELLLSDTGCSGMATAGSGDVLSGLLSSILSYSSNSLLAVAAGAYINGKAGEEAQARFGSISMVASDTVSSIRDVIGRLEKANES